MDNVTGCPVALIRSGVGLLIGRVGRAEKTGSDAVWIGESCARLADTWQVQTYSSNILKAHVGGVGPG